MATHAIGFFELVSMRAKPEYDGMVEGAPHCVRCCKVRDDGSRAYRRIPEILLVEESDYAVTWRARCHGQEETLRVELPFGGDEDADDIKDIVAKNLVFFDGEACR